MLPPQLDLPAYVPKAGRKSHGVCVLRPKRTVRATFVAPFESLGTLLSSHRAITRVSLAAISFTLIIAFSQQAPALQAGPETAPVIPESLLPQNVGVGLPTDSAVTISFDTAMNPASVEDALQVLPSQPVELAWSDTLDAVTVTPERRWRTGATGSSRAMAACRRTSSAAEAAATSGASSARFCSAASRCWRRACSAAVESAWACADAPAGSSTSAKSAAFRTLMAGTVLDMERVATQLLG